MYDDVKIEMSLIMSQDIGPLSFILTNSSVPSSFFVLFLLRTGFFLSKM